ncbi:GatB/YqeY domain-containing protein [Aureibacter tunicatorum]|uniref:GatB/YqeY domain-containing protein n=1 Tax=Aureibacter tunicatorum TaxID=866807 RepID=A0AAE3XL97_9BACT|nr:GatB/YqeY domain-containing protein [Aureibacter tunicatorum]MDR6238064.1 hypothetical protein [Aureibacter tunicatorum]BDD03097.1 hypothetical protein AUTU_05800 [Aureibacter tunicatorum]
MSLKDKVNAEIKTAMKNKQKEELRALRAIKSMIMLAETEGGAAEALTEEQELKLLTKAAKQRKDSIDVFEKEGRDDLAEKEKEELAVISKFLPQPLTEDELREGINEIISEVGAEGPKDMGKVMGVATKKFAGRADGKQVSSIVKELLAK